MNVVFRDVPVTEWFARYVYDLIRHGIASGYRARDGTPLGLYGPADPVTYAEIAKMALEAANKTGAAATAPKNRFARDHWAERYIALAEHEQLSVYTPALNIDQPASRGEVIQTLLEAFSIPLDEKMTVSYHDLRSSHPHARDIATATRLGIIQGDTDRHGRPTGIVRPNDPVNRAEVAKIVALMMAVVQ